MLSAPSVNASTHPAQPGPRSFSVGQRILEGEDVAWGVISSCLCMKMQIRTTNEEVAYVIHYVTLILMF